MNGWTPGSPTSPACLDPFSTLGGLSCGDLFVEASGTISQTAAQRKQTNPGSVPGPEPRWGSRRDPIAQASAKDGHSGRAGPQ
jgi:hypothetical protein